MTPVSATAINYARIPAELRDRAQWVTSRFERRDGKITKPPFRADGRGKASTTDPTTWSTFAMAVAGNEVIAADGVGFVFTADDPYVGIDLDAGLDEFERCEIQQMLNSYSETSVSGAGVHIIVRASLNGHPRNRHGPIEVYDHGRFFVMTGAHVPGTPATIEDRQAELDEVLRRFLPAPATIEHRERRATVPVALDDRELLERAFAAKNGARVEALWNGDTSAHGGDDSAADLALCGALSFWTGPDPARIDSLYRRSGLTRPKWDERRGDSTYGAQTIETALAGRADFYRPPGASPDRTTGRAGSKVKPANSYLRTDVGNAEMFVDRHAHRLRHVKERRLWLDYRDGRWHADTTGEAERAARQVARERVLAALDFDPEDDKKRKALIAWAMTSEGDARIRGMLNQAATQQAIVLRADDLDADPFLLACGNGTIDLRTGKLRPSTPADLISLGTDVPYDPTVACPRWERFLQEVFASDSDLITFVQRFVGYCLTGDTREQIVPVLHGSGGNGKDTLIKPIMRILGDGLAKTCPFDTFARTRDDRGARNDLARLHRARVVVASESSEGRRLDEAVIKLVSGGGRIAARFLYGEFFEFTPMFKILLVTNHKPRVDGDDDAIWRRLRLIPFEESFIGREDKQLDVTLETELPGILAWAVRGSLDWQREGLPTPAAVETATSEYRSDEDALGAFIAERCTLHGETTPTALREAYEAYCTEIGERPLSANILGKRLARRGIKRAGRNSAYHGIGLK